MSDYKTRESRATRKIDSGAIKAAGPANRDHVERAISPDAR